MLLNSEGDLPHLGALDLIGLCQQARRAAVRLCAAGDLQRSAEQRLFGGIGTSTEGLGRRRSCHLKERT